MPKLQWDHDGWGEESEIFVARNSMQLSYPNLEVRPVAALNATSPDERVWAVFAYTNDDLDFGYEVGRYTTKDAAMKAAQDHSDRHNK